MLTKRITKAGYSHPEKFPVFWKFFLLWNKTLCFWKIHRFSCNTGPFLSVCGNFLLPIGGNSFPILPGTECSSIQKFRIYFRCITYFAGFWQNNNVFTQNNHGLKKDQLRKKFRFQQLVMKIANFADVRWSNSIFMKKEKKKCVL